MEAGDELMDANENGANAVNLAARPRGNDRRRFEGRERMLSGRCQSRGKAEAPTT